METTIEAYLTLSPVAKLILQELYICASEGAGLVGVPIRGIARRTGVRDPQVMKALDELHLSGFLAELGGHSA